MGQAKNSIIVKWRGMDTSFILPHKKYTNAYAY